MIGQDVTEPARDAEQVAVQDPILRELRHLTAAVEKVAHELARARRGR